ncbi:MAG: AIR synthase-related protein [Planctomycetota bacterium]|nr:AIR synthase-related protein [Planctomycetota bacterium]MCX8040551.1 AIR synthase-related protein [Planctomycetota bacterium]MDW8372358.1 AIR synthase-related protein [Planctomycetota bacterium]
MPESQPADRYAARGVSASKQEVHAATQALEAGLFPGAFCRILPDLLGGSEAHCLVMHSDGAGSKSAAYYLAWREGAPAALWRGLAQDALAMNLDDCACVGALGPFLVTNSIARNAHRIPGTVIAEIIAGYQDCCERLRAWGIACALAGGETADLGDLVRTLVVDATVIARLRREEVIDASRIAPGDVLVGFSSTGQAAWEDRPHSGIGANGLTSARHDLLAEVYRYYGETFAPETDPLLIYAGTHRLADPLPGDPRFTIASALTSPTRLYTPLIAALLAELPRGAVHGLIHCTGGGQDKIRRFGRPGNRYIKDAPFPVPPVFAAIRALSCAPWDEMYRTFNMGWRLEAAVEPAQVETCLRVAARCGIEARVVGRVEGGGPPQREVIIHTPDGPISLR